MNMPLAFNVYGILVDPSGVAEHLADGVARGVAQRFVIGAS
jgi:TMEM175 potassium channel family protein